MKSAEQLLKGALVGQILIQRGFDDEPLKIPRKIMDVYLGFSDSREDPVICLDLENPNGDLHHQIDDSRTDGLSTLWVYRNEPIILKEVKS